MNKKISTIFVAFVLFFSAQNVNAECNYEEKAKLNREAANIKVKYAENKRVCNMQDNWCGYEEGEDSEGYGAADDEFLDPDYVDPSESEYTDELEYFDVSILNVTENLYIKVKNNVGFGPKQYDYLSAKDGIITFFWDNIMDVANFTFEVYASNKTNCANEKLRVLYLTTPRLNLYSYYETCEENPDYYMCEKYVTFPEDLNFTPGDFDAGVEKYIEDKNEKPSDEQPGDDNEKGNIIKDFIDDNKLVIFGVGTAVLIIIIIFIVVPKVKGKKNNETKW